MPKSTKDNSNDKKHIYKKLCGKKEKKGKKITPVSPSLLFNILSSIIKKKKRRKGSNLSRGIIPKLVGNYVGHEDLLFVM